MSTLAALAIVGVGMYYYQHRFAADPTTPSTGKPPTKRGGKHSKESDVPEGPKPGKVEVMKAPVSKPLSVEAQVSTAKKEAQEKLAKAEGAESSWDWKSAIAATESATSSLFDKVLNTSLEVDTDIKKQVAIKNTKPKQDTKAPTIEAHVAAADKAATSGQSGVVGMGNAATTHLEEPTVVAPPVTHPPEQLPPPYRENGRPIPPKGHVVGSQSFHHFGHPNCPENTWCNVWAAGEKASKDDQYGYTGHAESEGHAMINHHCKNDPMCTKHHQSTSDSCMKADLRLAPRADGKSWREVIPGCNELPWYYNLPPVDMSMVTDPWFASQPTLQRYHMAEVMANIASGAKHDLRGGSSSTPLMTDKCYKTVDSHGNDQWNCKDQISWGRAVQDWNSWANIAKSKKGQSQTDYSQFYKPIPWHP